MATPRFQPTNVSQLSTVHQNFVQPVENLFNAWNGDNPDVLGGYNETTACIQQFLGEALARKKTVRVLGGNWSWTTVGFTNHWMVNTSRLNRMKRILPTEVERSQHDFVPDSLLFAQCGCSVQEVNRVLQSLGRSLPTTGASNGQSIAGVFSNGTHGSAIDFGATPEFVVGLHLVTGPDSQVYLERASRPVVSDLFVQKLGATLLRDDALFNAALVSFGSFGFIHGVMLSTEPLFLLNVFRLPVETAAVQPLLQTLDFTNTPFLPRPGVRPHHFQAVLDPFEPSTTILTVMYKTAYRPDYPRFAWPTGKAGPGEDAPVLLGGLTTLFPVLTPVVVQQAVKGGYVPLNDVWGTQGEIFSNVVARGKVLSTALGIPVDRTNDLLKLALALNRRIPFAGVFSFRYVRQTGATLGFTRFTPTCVAEFDSFDAPATWQFYRQLWAAVEEAGIPFTFHWGKINNLTPERLHRMYGSNVAEWLAARNAILPMEMQPVFTNAFMKEVGLLHLPAA